MPVSRNSARDVSQSDPAMLSIRVDLPNGGRLGPGQAELLRKLVETGSLNATARAMGMSYPKALKLIRMLEHSFSDNILETEAGGRDGGGTRVTATGARILALYDMLVATSLAVSRDTLAELDALTR